MGRATFDRSADDWEKVVDAVRYAGGGHVAIPALDLRLILHGYKQMQAERAAALALVGEWERDGVIDPAKAEAMCAALGATNQAAPPAVLGVDTRTEGCVDHIPVASASCRECARVQGVTL
ncbi:hypothetical protein [Streptosporangium sp. NPDC002721]|uniref:hypothetical protein n=1 Tax=Streptosporangium sp. NPDC002721 TaxID=3366188 RepID=UPI003694935D